MAFSRSAMFHALSAHDDTDTFRHNHGLHQGSASLLRSQTSQSADQTASIVPAKLLEPLAYVAHDNRPSHIASLTTFISAPYRFYPIRRRKPTLAISTIKDKGQGTSYLCPRCHLGSRSPVPLARCQHVSSNSRMLTCRSLMAIIQPVRPQRLAQRFASAQAQPPQARSSCAFVYSPSLRFALFLIITVKPHRSESSAPAHSARFPYVKTVVSPPLKSDISTICSLAIIRFA
ncbi:hypothetical protein BBOH_1519 [Bifidobacterium bohemicum DSM 22767]|uniref:Uncharacterized protein n=1 Tax=Bifidobacterium bohemicum DSM 22767 TaxID=1437606 RepID=A0A086ZE42_9BIFI|nr:hypothetical protein BBOH_1519 [Bifidobacterium bohemicum DSM 22767]